MRLELNKMRANIMEVLHQNIIVRQARKTRTHYQTIVSGFDSYQRLFASSKSFAELIAEKKMSKNWVKVKKKVRFL